MSRKQTRPPRVCTEDVRDALWRAIQPVFPGKPEPSDGTSVIVLAERAEVSSRTVYRVLEPGYGSTMNLDMADRLLLAANSHLSFARVVEAEEDCACGR